MQVVRDAILQLEDSPILDVWRMGRGRPDVIGLWAGESDLPTPAAFCEAASAALLAGQTFYSDNRGIPTLRRTLADYTRRLYGIEIGDERIAVTGSGMNAVVLIAQALFEPGHNLVCITPSWPNITRAAAIAGATVRTVPLGRDERGWHLDFDALFAACDEHTKAIYYASPGNPTGWMMEPAELVRLLDFTRTRGIAIIADEVYQRIVYDRRCAPSILEIATPDDAVFAVNSFSKAWAMTGWRLGWMVYPSACRDTFEKLIQFNTSGAQPFLQAGAIVALEQGEAFVESFVARCRAGRDVVNARLAEMPTVHIVPNNASFYTMFSVDGVDDTRAFCMRAVQQIGVGLAPGSAFGAEAAGQIRLCYARSPATLNEAMDRLQGFIEELGR